MENALIDPPTTRGIDTLELYRWAVQDPETHAAVLRIMHARLRPGRVPLVHREDFAGTSAESVAWVALGRGRRAVAVDLDGRTLAWARARAQRLLGDRAGDISFVEADVMRTGPGDAGPADLISVLNFSICYLRTQEALRAYAAHAARCLAPGGLLVLNLFGGPGATRPCVDRHRVVPRPRLPGEHASPPFDYVWEQRSWDPASRTIDCRIHFDAPDPADPARTVPVRDAFRYDWRLWTIPELAEALRAAGLDLVQVWRHTVDDAGRVFLGPVDPRVLDGLDRWCAYIVAGPA